MAIKKLFIYPLMVFVIFVSCSKIISHEQDKTQDLDKENAELIDNIRKSARKSLSIDLLLKEIKKEPVLNTQNEFHRKLFSRGSTEKDPDHPEDFINSSKCHPLVYWKIGKNKIGLIKIVGVYYDKEEKPRVFFALLGS